jgi:hypothetical protein
MEIRLYGRGSRYGIRHRKGCEFGDQVGAKVRLSRLWRSRMKDRMSTNEKIGLIVFIFAVIIGMVKW